MAKKDKKGEYTAKDSACYYLNIVGGFLVIICIVPFMPWRYNPINANFGARFSIYRMYSLLSMTDKFGAQVPWLTYRREICRAMMVYNSPNPLNMLVGMVAMGANKATGVAIGGAALGCANWQACKDHTAARCTGYTTMAITGIVCAIFFLLSAIASFCVPVFMGMEAGIKKKKAKAAAKGTTMTVAIIAFVLSFLSLAVYLFTSDSVFKGFQSTGYYPYPMAFAGAYACGLGVFLQGVGMYCSISRCKEPKKAGDEEGEEGGEGEAEGPVDPSLPPPGAGPPGMFEPGMPPPPPQH